MSVLESSRHSALSDMQLNRMQHLLLPDSVPEEIRVEYHGACMLWVLGNEFPRFFAWTSLHTGIALENAFRLILARRSIKFSGREGLWPLFSKVRDAGALDDKRLRVSEYSFLRELYELHDFGQRLEFEIVDIANQMGESYEPQPQRYGAIVDLLARVIQEIRNEVAHGEHITAITEQTAHHHLQLVRSIILVLFDPAA